ncbi:MAG: oligosaccharide flippase family protein [Bryobacterales bacterium]|nr:oligosaccharide flippase family protein [Bryobacterales bacterium]
MPKLLSGLASLGINVLLMRYLTTEEFGRWSLCAAAILACDAIVGSALDLTVLKEAPAWDRDDRARSIAFQQSALLVKIVGGLGLLALLVVAASPLSRLLFRSTEHAPLVPLAGAVALGMLMLRTAQIHVQIRGNLKVFGALDLAHFLMRMGGVGLLIALGQVSTGAVLVSFLFAPLLAFACWASTAGREVVQNVRVDRPMMRLLFANLGWYLLTFGLSGAISRMDVFVLSQWTDLREVGIYSAGATLAIIPQILGSYLSVLFSPKITPLLNEGRFFNYFRRVQGGILALTALSYLVFRLTWPPAATYLLPASFVRSGDIVQALIPGALAGMATLPLTLSFILFVRPRFFFALDCVAVPFLLAGYYFGLKTSGVVGAAWVTTGVNLSRALIAQVLAWKWARESDLSRNRL